VRSPETAVGLDFVPLIWERFQIATTRAQSGGLRPLLDALAHPAAAHQIVAPGRYNFAGRARSSTSSD
jgi:molybdate-binding protein